MLNENNFSENQQKLIDALYGGNVLAIAPKGFGKCSCAQTAAQELIAEGVCERILIVAPLKVAELTWAGEHKKWSHLHAPAMAIGTEKQRMEAVESGNCLVVINNENVAWLVKNYRDEWPFDGLIIDESTKFKSAGSSRVMALRPLLKKFNWRVGLSATPVTESSIEIYAQVLLVDGGKALGRCQDAFRHKYFMTTDYLGYDWTFQPGGAERLAHALRHVIYTAKGEDYEDSLPELCEHLHFITLPEPARAAYSAMAGDMLTELSDEEIEAPSAAVMTLKLQQIAAGAMYGENKAVHRLHNKKIAWLKNYLKPHHRVLISYWFQFELDALRKAFPGLPVLVDDPAGMTDAWNTRAISRLAVHPASAGHGLNLQDGGHTLICLGPIWSLDAWSQLVGRLRRRGQKSKVVDRHVVVAADTVDKIMLARLSGKEEAEKSIMEHIKNAAEKKPG